MKNRLKFFIVNVLKVTIKDFAESVGTPRTYISQIIGESASREIGIDLLVRIKAKYPTLNLNWLLYNQGDVLINDSSVTYKSTAACTECGHKDRLIATLQRSLTQALDANDILKAKIEKLKNPNGGGSTLT